MPAYDQGYPRANVPVPDPTTLTTAQLRREVQSLREVVETRLDAMDKAAMVFADNLNRVPTLLDREILRLTQLFDEKFGGVQIQFKERDVRSSASEVAASTAVSAALQAQKEAAAAQNESNAAAITKSEVATVKQLDGIIALLSSNSNSLNDKISVINGRLDRGEGSHHQKADSSANFYSIASLAVSIVVAVFVGLGLILSKVTPSPPPRDPIPYYQPRPAEPGVVVSPAVVGKPQ